MTLSMRMGLRNLARQKRRTVLTGMMLLIGTALAVWMNGISQGTYALFIDGTTRTMLGHFQVLKDDFHNKPTLFKTVNNPLPIQEALSGVAGVQAVTSRIESAGLLAAGSRTTGIGLVGVDPVREPLTTNIPRMVKRGEWFSAKRSKAGEDVLPIIVGKRLAKRLKVDLGSEVSFVGQAADGSIAAELFTVIGILESGATELDGALALVRLNDAQELFAMGNRVHRIIGTVTSTSELDRILPKLPRAEGYRLLSWKQLDPAMYDSIKADRDSGQVMLWAVMLMAVLGVANAMLMSVFERTREFGIMLALGTSPGQIVRITLWEVAWLSLLSIAMGTALGVALTSFLVIPLSEPMEWGGVVMDAMRGKNTVFGSLITPVLILVASMLSGLWPASRAARLNPLVALRAN